MYDVKFMWNVAKDTLWNDRNLLGKILFFWMWPIVFAFILMEVIDHLTRKK